MPERFFSSIRERGHQLSSLTLYWRISYFRVKYIYIYIYIYGIQILTINQIHE